jgi:hypothetical protein
MMKATIAIATSVAVGTAAVSVEALDLHGAEIDGDLTKTLLSNPLFNAGGREAEICPEYQGTGSTDGELAMQNGLQEIAPMARFLNVNAGNCAASNGGTTAEGIVFALDSASIVAGTTNASNAACNGTAIDCNNATDPSAGLAFDKILPNSGYQISDWRDVLRVLYMGIDHNGVKDCRSAARVELVGSWSNLFEGSCPTGTCTSAAGGNTTAGSVCRSDISVPDPGVSMNPQDCTAAQTIAIPSGIQHLFRRSDALGSSDIFVTLLQAGAGGSAVRGIALGGSGAPASSLYVSGAGFDEFCGTRVPGLGIPLPPKPKLTAPSDPPFPVPSGPVTGGTFTAVATTPFFADMQDWDPIRRRCAGSQTEDVCSARGDLGLVLPIYDPPANTFSTSPCINKFQSRPGVAIGSVSPIGTAQCPAGSSRDVLGRCIVCPDGGALVGGTSCAVPTDASNSALCNATQLTAFPPHPVIDGRAQNLWARNAATGTIVTTSRARQTGGTDTVAMVGAYYRLHQAHSFSGRTTCNPSVRPPPDPWRASDAIGCLVDASPCSLGIATRRAADPSINPNTLALKVNGIDPLNQCIQDVLNLAPPSLPESRPALYPLSHPLFLNTLVGFENLPGAFSIGAVELALAQNFADPAAAETLAAVTNPITGLDGLGFVPLPGSSGLGTPFCQDFHESACPGATNPACTTNADCSAGRYCLNPTGATGAGKCEVDACLNNPPGIPVAEVH